MKRIILPALLMLVLPFAYGQQDPLVAKYRQMAVDYQQQIKMAHSQLSGAESKLEAAKSDFLPRLDFAGNYSYYGVPLQLAPPADNPTGPGSELDNFYSLHLILSQPIFTGGYLKNTKLAAMSETELMKGLVELNKQDVMLNADILYWNAVSRKEANTLQIFYRDAIGEFLKVIQDRVDEEIVGRNELYQTKVRYDDAQYEVIRSEKDYKVSIMELNRLLGLPITNELEIADSLIAVNWQQQNGNLQEKAFAQRPELSMLQSQIELNQHMEKITASKYNPTFGISLDGKWGAPSPGLSTDPAFNFIAQANLAIPVFYWGKKKEELFAIQQQTEVSRLQMEQTKDMVSLEVSRSLFELQSTQEQLNFAASALDNAAQNVSVMLDRYNEGLSSVLEVLDSQLYWQKSYLNYIQAKYQLNIAYSQYLRALGEFGQL